MCIRDRGIEVARLNLDQQVVAPDVDDVAAEVGLQRGVEGAFGELADTI